MSGISTPVQEIVSTFKRLLDADVAVPVAAMNSLVSLRRGFNFACGEKGIHPTASQSVGKILTTLVTFLQ